MCKHSVAALAAAGQGLVELRGLCWAPAASQQLQQPLARALGAQPSSLRTRDLWQTPSVLSGFSITVAVTATACVDEEHQEGMQSSPGF